MTKKELAKRLFALVLTFMITLSMTGYDFVEAFAEDGEVNTVEENEGTLDETENAGSETSGSTDNAVTTEDAATEADVKPEAVPETVTEPVEPAAEAEVQLAEIAVKASKDENFVSVFWQKVDGAAYYMVSLAEDKNGILEAQEQKVEAGKECKWVFKSDKGGTVKVEAYRVKAKAEDTAETADGETAAAAPEYEKFAEGTAAELDEIKRPKIASGSTQAVYTGHSLRELLGEPNDGYAVAQGAATDGTYAYYMLASSTTQMGRVLKIRLSDGAVVGRGPVIAIHHANGMTYDSKRHKLVAVGYGAHRQNLSYIDPDTLKLDEKQPNRTLKYSYASKISGMPSGAQNNGIAAISYIPKYDVYVARSRGKVSGYPETTGSANNNIWVFNAENLEAIGHIYTKVTSAYPETYQAMDADEKYVYFLLSPGSGQSRNIILALDWNSENLQPVLNGEAKFVDHMWSCNNDSSGRPDAVINIPVGHESEGLFHTTNSNGTSHFYLSEYFGRNHYTYVYKTVKYKVKWKKVKKRVKWKRVKKKGKWKWKYKKVKVWKYKTKKKKDWVAERDYWARDNYVYDLGSF